jgi:hypothetical protein
MNSEEEANNLEFFRSLFKSEKELFLLFLILKFGLIDLINLSFDNLHSAEMLKVSLEIFFGLAFFKDQSLFLDAELIGPGLTFTLNYEAMIGVHAIHCDPSTTLHVLHIVHLSDQLVHLPDLFREPNVFLTIGLELFSGLFEHVLEGQFFHGYLGELFIDVGKLRALNENV